MEELKGQLCPICRENKCTLREEETDVPYFGLTFIFSMICEGCGYKKTDVEAAENREPCKYSFEIEDEKDLDIRFVKSSEATVKIPHIMTIEPGPSSEGYITNIEGLLLRVKKVLEDALAAEEDEDNEKKLRNMIKKLSRVLAGHEKLKINVEDPTGNSAILSEKAVKVN